MDFNSTSHNLKNDSREKEINRFVNENKEKFPAESWDYVMECLNEMDDRKFQNCMSYSFKNPDTLFWIAFLFGVFGIDRFLLDDIGLGIVKLLTFGQMLIGYLVDCFTVHSRTKQYNMDRFMEISVGR